MTFRQEAVSADRDALSDFGKKERLWNRHIELGEIGRADTGGCQCMRQYRVSIKRQAALATAVKLISKVESSFETVPRLDDFRTLPGRPQPQ